MGDEERYPELIFDAGFPDNQNHEVVFDSGKMEFPVAPQDRVYIEEYKQGMLIYLQTKRESGAFTQSDYELARLDLKAKIKQFFERLDN